MPNTFATAQEAGLLLAAQYVRAIVPPQLEAVIIVYPPGDPAKISSVIAAVESQAANYKHVATFKRSVVAAKAYAATKPNNPNFNPQS